MKYKEKLHYSSFLRTRSPCISIYIIYMIIIITVKVMALRYKIKKNLNVTWASHESVRVASPD